ncbi:MAG: OmpH family outer membrane protein, partial [Planctomycetes bacterium]|nr:OmpH family outer membrane protein [Planctomycetota bacterium]
KTADLEASFDQTRRQLGEQRDALQGRIDRLRRALQEELQPGTADYRARSKELALLEAEMQYFIESKGAEIEQGLAESLRSIYDDIHATVQVVAEDRGIDIVLAADQMPSEAPQAPTQVRQQILLQKVLYWTPRVDLTDDVVARLNTEYEAVRKKTSSGTPEPGD